MFRRKECRNSKPGGAARGDKGIVKTRDSLVSHRRRHMGCMCLTWRYMYKWEGRARRGFCSITLIRPVGTACLPAKNSPLARLPAPAPKEGALDFRKHVQAPSYYGEQPCVTTKRSCAQIAAAESLSKPWASARPSTSTTAAPIVLLSSPES